MTYNYKGIIFNLDQALVKKYEREFLEPIEDHFMAAAFSRAFPNKDISSIDPAKLSEAAEKVMIQELAAVGK